MTTTPQQTTRGSYLPHYKRDKNRKPPLILQDRDISIIKSIFDNRFLTLSLLTQLFPPDRTRTPKHVNTDTPQRTGTNLERRLAKLFHNEYIHRFRTEIGGEIIYALDNKGARLLKDRQLVLPLSETWDETWKEKNRDLSNLYVHHALMVARFRTALELALKEHPTLSLYSFERDNKKTKIVWTSEVTKKGKTEEALFSVNPDAYFILEQKRESGTPAHLPYFVECDRSTMTLSRLLAKFEIYSRMYTEGMHRKALDIDRFRVLTITNSKERASNITKIVSGDTKIKRGYTPKGEKKEYTHNIPDKHKSFFCFTTEESYQDTPQNIFAEIWRKPDNTENLRFIIPSPLQRR